VGALALAATPGAARAYADGAVFAEPATSGGGGGRFFSGAPADGYTCAVCHRGGGSFAPTVGGLAPDGYRPGETYTLSIEFPSAIRNVGAILEIADGTGRGAGSLELVPDGELEAADECRIGGNAMERVPAPDRLVARAEVCGARRARVRWTAPATPVASLRLFASLVAADDSGDPSGDATAQIAQPLRALGGADLEGGRLSSTCAASPGPTSPGALLALIAAALFTVARFSVRRDARGATRRR
jgi:hypothetical protein